MIDSRISSANSDKSAGNDEVVVDLVGLIGRHWQLILVCTIFTAALGGTYCLVTEKVFESTADILIDQKHSPTLNEQTSQDMSSFSLANPLETHKLVVKSPLIIEDASERENLLSLTDLRELEHDELNEHWEDHLQVEIPEDDASVLEVSYRGSSPEDCQKIVGAIVDSYRNHLTKNSAALGSEITSLISRGKDELLSQIQNLEADYAEFQKTAPLLWREGEGINLFQERQNQIEDKRKELLVEKSMLEAQIRGVVEALKRGGRSRDAVYYQALIELRGADNEDTIERESSRGYSFELSKEYMELLALEREMSVQYGDGHPDLLAMRARLAELKGAVENSMGRELEGGVSVDFDSRTNEMSRPEYIDIYLRMLEERSLAFDLQLAALDREFDVATREAEEIQQYIAKDKAMRADQERTDELFDAVVARLEEINIIQDYGGETMKIIAAPSLGEQVWPSIPIVMAISILLGGLTGTGWALVRELTLRVFTDPQEIRDVLQAPVLGQIPFQKGKRINEAFIDIDPSLGVVHDSNARFAESFRGIRTALHYSIKDDDAQVIQITSSTPGDGKSTTAANLAASIANSSRTVVLLDADMRRPTVHKLFGLTKSAGLSEVLQRRLELDDVMKSTAVPNLDVITAGTTPESPAELLTQEQFDELVEKLKLHYDMVVIDSPPLLAVSDPSIIAPRVEGVILVVRIRERVRAATERARDILQEVGANLVGAAVNGVHAGRGGYGYGYGKNYGNLYRSGYSYGYGYAGSDKYYGASETDEGQVERAEDSNSTRNKPTVKIVDIDQETSTDDRAAI